MFNYFNNLIEQLKIQRSDYSKKTNLLSTVIASAVAIIMFLVFEYIYLIPVNFRSPSFIMMLAVILIAFNVIRSLLSLTFDSVSKISIIVIVLLLGYNFIGQFVSAEFFHAKSYQALLQLDETADFYEDNKAVSYQNIPVVDRDSAQRLGDRKMGEIVDYVSQFEVDNDYNQINYKNKPYRVTTISYSDLIKWFTNHQNGLPAYIKVDMVTQESEVVRLEKPMKYSHSDLFFRNINRYIRMKYPTKMFESAEFEINDKGEPYFIAPVYNYTIGVFGGKDITGAILVNASTGEHEYYDVENVPSWVDRVYPAEMLLKQLRDWGSYKKGYLNTLFSQKGVLTATEGYNYMAINDDVHLYTGLTSVSSDQSNVGFALINMRTKEAKYYEISGAEEYSAMSSAEGKVQNLHYDATFPILINVGGKPTYFLSLKDSAGLVKQYAFVSVENYQIVATGESVAKAEKEYYQLLEDNGQLVDNSIRNQITGTLTYIASAVVEGNTHYYLNVEGSAKVFIAPISVSDELPLLKPGTNVTIEYIENESFAQSVSSIIINK